MNSFSIYKRHIKKHRQDWHVLLHCTSCRVVTSNTLCTSHMGRRMHTKSRTFLSPYARIIGLYASKLKQAVSWIITIAAGVSFYSISNGNKHYITTFRFNFEICDLHQLYYHNWSCDSIMRTAEVNLQNFIQPW